MKIVTDITQGSDQWYEIRRGVLSASLASNLLTPTGRPSTSADKIRHRLLAEKLGWQEPEESFQTNWMTRGINLEDEARRWFELLMNEDVEQVGFIMSDSGWAGCSPDGIIRRDDQIIPVEIKCPKPSTHIGWMELAKNDNWQLPPEHRAQVHFQMAITGAPFAYFVSYCPVTEPIVVIVEADDFTQKMGAAIIDHCEKSQAMFDKLTLKGEVK